MKTELTARIVTNALVMAMWRRGKPDALLHHSEQGSQYASEQFQELMADSCVACSVSRCGNILGNAVMESFFSSLETGRISGRVYRTHDEACADVFDYIERFYNAVRRQPTICYVIPVEFRQKVGLAKMRVHKAGSRPRDNSAIGYDPLKRYQAYARKLLQAILRKQWIGWNHQYGRTEQLYEGIY